LDGRKPKTEATSCIRRPGKTLCDKHPPWRTADYFWAVFFLFTGVRSTWHHLRKQIQRPAHPAKAGRPGGGFPTLDIAERMIETGTGYKPALLDRLEGKEARAPGTRPSDKPPTGSLFTSPRAWARSLAKNSTPPFGNQGLNQAFAIGLDEFRRSKN